MVEKVGCEIPELHSGTAIKTFQLEFDRGKQNCECRGEIRRYEKEYQVRRQRSGSVLTLRNESMGSEED